MDRRICSPLPGGPERLALAECEVAKPQRHEVLLRHVAIGCNRVDVLHRRQGPLPQAAPIWLGVEAIGLVEAWGDGVTGLSVGDRMGYALCEEPGAYSDRRVVEAWRLLPVPRTVPDVEAAALLRKGLCAEMLVRRVYRAGPGQKVVVHAATSGVGLILCQWLRSLGVFVIGTVGSADKVAVAIAHGCHQAVVRDEEDVVAAVHRCTRGRMADVVYDGGAEPLAAAARCLRPRGMLVRYGEDEDHAAAPCGQDASLYHTRPRLADYLRTVQEGRRAAQALFTLVHQGAVRPPAAHVLPLAQAQAAHRLLEDRARTGPVVLVP